ncbi:MAG: AAA family ATPase [Myxococcota bacterium]
MVELAAASQDLRTVIERASRGLVQRDVAVQLVVLAAVAREHLLLIGPPGTAKSEAVRRVAAGIGGRYFEYLVGRFTEPAEIFGPVDLQRLRQGVVETQTAGMLPEADVAFLDEVFLGSTAILNTLLGVLNERVFRRGQTQLDCPLRVCVGASNTLPNDPALAAFSDRFLLHLFLEPIADPHLETLLEAGWSLSDAPASATDAEGSLQSLDTLIQASRAIDIHAVRGSLAEAIRVLRGEGIEMSDRRVVKLQRLIAAAAVLDGRTVAHEGDLWPVIFAIPRPGDQDRARDLLRALLDRSTNETLPGAAENASLGPLVRAQRLVSAGQALLETDPGDDATARRRLRLELEGVGREIDAGFAPDALPEGLGPLRQRIVTKTAELSD